MCATRKMLSGIDSDGSGITCCYYDFKEYGVKCFYREKNRDHSFALQKLASFHGAAPKCWKRFNFKTVYNMKVYAFFTEKALVACDFDDYREIRENRWKILEKLDAIGIGMSDTHSGNWGLIGTNPVWIDFGEPEQGITYKGIEL